MSIFVPALILFGFFYLVIWSIIMGVIISNIIKKEFGKHKTTEVKR